MHRKGRAGEDGTAQNLIDGDLSHPGAKVQRDSFSCKVRAKLDRVRRLLCPGKTHEKGLSKQRKQVQESKRE
jgi:hypothetical protein